MTHRVHPTDRLGDPVGVPDIPPNMPIGTLRNTVPPGERRHRMPPPGQGPNHGTPEKPRRPGNQHLQRVHEEAAAAAAARSHIMSTT